MGRDASFGLRNAKILRLILMQNREKHSFDPGCSALRLKDNILNALEKRYPARSPCCSILIVKKGFAGFQPVCIGIVFAEAEEKGARPAAKT